VGEAALGRLLEQLLQVGLVVLVGVDEVVGVHVSVLDAERDRTRLQVRRVLVHRWLRWDAVDLADQLGVAHGSLPPPWSRVITRRAVPPNRSSRTSSARSSAATCARAWRCPTVG